MPLNYWQLNEQTLSIGDAIIYYNDEYYDDCQLPRGVSYDPSSNLITLSGCNLEKGIMYAGDVDLSIKVSGENNVSDPDGVARLAASFLTQRGDGDIRIGGSGKISNQSPFFIWQEDSLGDLYPGEREGDIYIENITLDMEGTGIFSNCSNVYIKNAKLNISNGAFGITAGRLSNETGVHEGMLSIYNSDIEIRNCTTALACNQYEFRGVNIYGGNTTASYQMDTATMFTKDHYANGYDRYYIADCGYLHITPEILELSKLHYIFDETASTEKGEIWLSKDSATAGEQINITVVPDSGYILDRLELDGKRLSGTSFTMPDHDVTVEAFFKKGSSIESPTVIGNAQISSLKLRGESKNIAAGKKLKLEIICTPSTGNKNVTWSVSNKKYATVSASGVVKTKKAGAGKTVTITATATDGSKKSATYRIRLMRGVVRKISLKGSKTVKAGKAIKLKAIIKATNGANKKLTFSSSNPKYATVTKKGIVKATTTGKGKTVKITAKATDGSGKKATIKIKIK